MKTKAYFLGFLVILTMLLPVPNSWADGNGTVPDQRLVGHWQGTNRFTGISYEEYQAHKVMAQMVTNELTIAADGSVTGHVGGAELTECVVEQNRGWFGRMLNIETDYIIRGKIKGEDAPGSDASVHVITAPLNLKDGKIDGTLFVIRGTFLYPYPFLTLRVSH